VDRPSWEMNDPVFEVDGHCRDYATWPWSGHRRFAYDLVRFVAPERIVELGTHYGTSLFAFCQAVKDAALPTECIAVDTWTGDEHSGQYGEDVIQQVQRLAATCFADVNIDLRRMLFDEALPTVPDESVDILHIDGLHTYEAASGDFQSWLGKLKPDGIVLLHDVAASSGYGSARFWQEVSGRHPGFAFEHSWGLGVLFPQGDALYRRIVEHVTPSVIALYEATAERELVQIQVGDVTGMVEERDGLVRNQKEQIAQLETRIDEMNRRLQSPWFCLRSALGAVLRKLGLRK